MNSTVSSWRRCRAIGSLVGLVAAWFTAGSTLGVALAAPPEAHVAPAGAVPNDPHVTGWQALAAMPAALEAGAGPRPQQMQAWHLDMANLAQQLAAAPLEGTPDGEHPIMVAIPMPDGTVERFSVVESPVMEPGLAALFPDLKTYWAQGVDDPTAAGRLELSPQGFRAFVRGARGAIFVDPYAVGESEHHAAYWLSDFGPPPSFVCDVREGAKQPIDPGSDRAVLMRAGPTLRTYRLAVAATGEYTSFFGSQAAAQANIVSMVNRVNLIYQTEVAVKFNLVANNINLVFTSASTDPYTNSDKNAMLDENQTTVDSIIGLANYDIGHVFGTSGGGVAQLGVVCQNFSKARGVSNSVGTTGNPYTVYTFAHEMGHQFSANHTFNSENGACSGNRSSLGAVEPGAGSTIMSYAGNCFPDNTASSADMNFHARSFDSIIQFIGSGGCAALSSTGNTAPVVNAGADFTIPARTPYVLTGSATDANGDSLTYSWEELDQGPALALSAGDNGASPINRSYAPTASASRTIPPIAYVITNSSAPGDILPTTSRTLNFRLTARDNRSVAGVNTDDMRVAVVGTAGPFRLTSHNSGGPYSGQQTVTWDTAGTNVSPISTASVRILLSTDGGVTFPTTLLASTPNNGSAVVTIPSVNSTTARLRIEPIGNIYFDITDANMTISPPPNPVSFAAAGSSVSDTGGNGNSSGAIDPGESAISIGLLVRNNGGLSATNVAGTITSLTPTVTIVSGTSAYADIAGLATGANAAPFVISVSPSHVCGDPINLRLSITSTQASATLDYALGTGTPGGQPGAPKTFTYTGSAVAIPDNDSTGVSVPLTVSGAGTIESVKVRINGTTCDTVPTSTAVGLNHANVGDLILSVIAPDLTAVTVFNRHAPGGVNFCQTTFDSSTPGLPNIVTATSASSPFTGAWLPTNDLTLLKGKSADGQWSFRARDRAAGSTGTIRSFSIIVTPQGKACLPPIAPCKPDYNADGNLNPDDLGDFITDYFTAPAISGPGGYAVPCAGEADPYSAGYRTDYNADCSLNPDDLGDYITEYFIGC